MTPEIHRRALHERVGVRPDDVDSSKGQELVADGHQKLRQASRIAKGLQDGGELRFRPVHLGSEGVGGEPGLCIESAYGHMPKKRQKPGPGWVIAKLGQDVHFTRLQRAFVKFGKVCATSATSKRKSCFGRSRQDLSAEMKKSKTVTFKHRATLTWRGLTYRYDKSYGSWRLVDKPVPRGVPGSIMEWHDGECWEVNGVRAATPVEALDGWIARLIDLRTREAKEADDHAKDLRAEVRRLRAKNLKASHLPLGVRGWDGAIHRG